MDNARSPTPHAGPTPAVSDPAARALRTTAASSAPSVSAASGAGLSSGPTAAPAPAAASSTASELPLGREVPIDWEALEDAFENNAPEVHSYLQLATGEVIRVVDGVADPQMHARIAADNGYLRVDPVSSREQYRWMERFIPMVEDAELRGRLNQAIDGKGAFRRFKDVLMAHAEERERWFTFRSERLKTFMDAWLGAHNMRAVSRPAWAAAAEEAPSASSVSSVSSTLSLVDGLGASSPGAGIGASPATGLAGLREAKRRSTEVLRHHLRDVAEGFGPRDLETLCAFADFLRARRVMRGHRGPELAEPESEDSAPSPPPESGQDKP